MDSNGTRHHLLFGREDWGLCTSPLRAAQVGGRPEPTLSSFWDGSPPHPDDVDLAWNDVRGELTLRPKLMRYIAAPADVAPKLTSRRGAGRDQFGNWYWIDESRQHIRVLSTGDGRTSEFWPGERLNCRTRPRQPWEFQNEVAVAPQALPLLSGLAITEDHYLVVGTLQPKGLLIFDLFSNGEPRAFLWPSAVDFAPFDMAPRSGGGVFVLDRDHRRYWTFDRTFHLISRDSDLQTLPDGQNDNFGSCDPVAPRLNRTRRFPSGTALSYSSPVSASVPVSIEALPDGTVLILDYDENAHSSFIYRYRFDVLLDSVTTDVLREVLEGGSEAKLGAFDLAFVPRHDEGGVTIPDRVYVASVEGNQTFAFDLCSRNGSLVLKPTSEFFPMRLFGGKGIIAAGQQVWYDFDDRWIPLVKQRRPRYEAFAVFRTPFLNGREPDCVWHRWFLDGCLPPETQVRIRSRAANTEAELFHTTWNDEPLPYRRPNGSELPFVRQSNTPREGQGTWEFLFQRARGQFLQLEVELQGNGRATPRLCAMRVYYPRFSYEARYLPAVYREDLESASFLDRFLANMEGVLTSIEDRIAAVEVLFDGRSSPEEALNWLASWFGVALDPAWDEQRRRLFILHAADFFQARGTQRGLHMALHLALDPCASDSIFSAGDYASSQRGIRIVERFLARKLPAVVLGDPTELEGIREAVPGNKWTPAQGVADLHQRWTRFRNPSWKPPQPVDQYPIYAPSDTTAAQQWREFSQQALGFVPSSVYDTRWRDFLARRYRHVGAANERWGTSWKEFDEVTGPERLPTEGAPLADWYQFQTVVLAMHRTAHRFTVLLPMTPSDVTAAKSRARADLARRIVQLEKPAHTVFDIKFYWAMFRIGEARLGADTAVDQGSRSALLMPPALAGETYVGESWLSPTTIERAATRTIIGRDTLGQGVR